MHRRGRRPLLSSALLPALALVACSSGTDDAQPVADTDGSAVSAEDGTGAEITLDAPAERVVCLDGTCIDALAELGLPPVASLQIDQVRHEYFFGPDVPTEPLDGTYFEPSIEGIVAAEPDLVVGAATVHASLSEALGDIPFYGATGESVKNLRALASLTGRESAGEHAIERYDSALEAYGPQVRDTVVLSMYGGATDDIGIDAADSAIGNILGQYTAYPWPEANEGDSGFLEIGLEDIIDVDPEHIFVLDFGFDPDAPDLVDQLATQPVWGTLQAVEVGNVHVVDNRWWGTTSGTRGAQLYLDVVMTTVYPDEFPEPLGIAAL